MSPFRIAVLCGGPSGERGISLNSARSVCDHLDAAGADKEIEISYLYYRTLDIAFPIKRAQLYSNTPLDFDFKLGQTPPLDAQGQQSWLSSMDLVLPLIHGEIGEDGQIQQRLESWNIPFWGSNSQACFQAYPKHGVDDLLQQHDLVALPCWILRPEHLASPDLYNARLHSIQASPHGLNPLIVKPRRGGSSLGVSATSSPQEALRLAVSLFAQNHQEVVIEPQIKGREFTVLVLENHEGSPVALIPTEIELRSEGVFSFQKKYLASEEVAHHTPPRFSEETITTIQQQAELLFSILSMRHFSRFDGWLLEDGRIAFTDINPISGMEQNSFLFQQTSRLGFSHRDTLRYLVERACSSYGISIPNLGEIENSPGKIPVAILGGGVTAEREVSLLSSTNVWMKLRASTRYTPSYFLLATEDTVWSVPYTLCLAHTVREITDACHAWPQIAPRTEQMAAPILQRLGLTSVDLHAPLHPPVSLSLQEFLHQHHTIFLGLHGGIGEDGRIQKMLNDRGSIYNGSGPKASTLCMDKDATGNIIKNLKKSGLSSLPKVLIRIEGFNQDNLSTLWEDLLSRLQGPSLIVKPVGDGCSAGVCRLDHIAHLERYLDAVQTHEPFLPENALRPGEPAIRMPDHIDELLFERFLLTDKLQVTLGQIEVIQQGGWIEVTVGVLGERGKVRALTPSVTVAEGAVLSLEEKFQGGTGVNITPPPPDLVSPQALARARHLLEIAAAALGIEGYARLDAFLERHTGDIVLIEANTLPGLSPSTVIFHQALAEQPPIYPREFLEILLDLGKKRLQ